MVVGHQPLETMAQMPADMLLKGVFSITASKNLQKSSAIKKIFITLFSVNIAEIAVNVYNLILYTYSFSVNCQTFR